MLLSFDVAREAIVEHDNRHSHEHFAERLSIPGIPRASRWTACGNGPRYFVLYEVQDLATLTSPAYLERLDHPSPWTTRMMPSYIGMRRALCATAAPFGSGFGGFALVIRFAAEPGRHAALRQWLVGEALPGLAERSGIASVRLFTAGTAAPMTNEQRIRGADATFESALFVTGYDIDAVTALAKHELRDTHFVEHGARMAEQAWGTYQLAYALAAAAEGTA